MGSAVPIDLGLEHCRALMADLELEARRAQAKGVDIPRTVAANLLEDALDNIQHHEALVLFLALYLSRCTTGSVPDYQHLDPASFPG